MLYYPTDGMIRESILLTLELQLYSRAMLDICETQCDKREREINRKINVSEHRGIVRFVSDTIHPRYYLDTGRTRQAPAQPGPKACWCYETLLRDLSSTTNNGPQFKPKYPHIINNGLIPIMQRFLTQEDRLPVYFSHCQTLQQSEC